MTAAESQQSSQRATTLEADIDALEDTLGYPGSLVETYRESMQSMGMRFPRMSAEELLFKVADVKDIKAAIQRQPSNGTSASKKAGLPSAPSVTPAKPVEMPRNKRGVIPVLQAIDLLVRRKPT